MTLKILLRAKVVLVAAVIQPAIYAAIAGLLLRHGHGGALPLSAALGVAMMGAWTSVLFFAGGMLTRERRQGTLEMLVAVPAPLFQTVLGSCLATAMMVLYSMVTAVLVAAVFFHTPLHLADPAAFVAAVVTTIMVMTVFGIFLSAFFVLYRQAAIFQNAMEFPVWLASGLLVPLSLLPLGIRVIGWLLPPTWPNLALARAASGGGSVAAALAASVAVGAAYLVAGGALLVVAERRARVLATLRLS
jgi:ABC-2 type transport system permease protein